MRSLRLLVLRRLRQAPVRAGTTVLAIAAGVALAVSITIVLASIDRSLADFGRGVAGPAPLRISGATLTGGVPEEAIEQADGVPGVADVVPVVQAVSRTQPEPGGALAPALVLGVDCRIEAVLGPVDCDAALIDRAEGAIALGPQQGGGPASLLRTDQGSIPLGGAPVLDELADVGDGRVVILPLAVAQEAFTRGSRYDTAYLLLDDGAEVSTVRADVQEAIGDHLPVVDASAAPAGSDSVLGGALPIFTLLGLFALGIGAVLVANTAAMSLETRRRELAVLGALGGRPSTVVVTTVAELALLGAVGGLLGSLGGAVVAGPIVRSLSSFTEEVVGATLTTHVAGSAVVTGVLLGALLGGGAALWPARRASRMDVAAELSGREASDVTTPPRLGRRLVVWSLVALGGAAACWAAQRGSGLDPWQATVVTPAFLATAIGCLFATAAATPLLFGRMSRLAAQSPFAALRLGLAAARRDHRRTGLLAVTVGAAVVTAFVTEGSSASARASIEATFERGGEGVDIATVPPEDGSGPNVTPELLASLAGVPGVAVVREGVFVVASPGDGPILVQSVTDNPLTLDVVDGEASPSRLADGEVLIGVGLARNQAIRAGDRVEVVTPDGPVSLPVQGIWEDGNNVGANITMSPQLLEELYGPQAPGFVSLRPAPGVSEAELAGRVRAADLHPELRTRSSAQVADDIADEVDAQFASFRVMQQALLAVLFAAVLSSLLLAGVQRRRELGLLGAVGAEPRGLARMLLVEAGLVALAGVALAVLIGPVMMFSLNQVLPFVVGFRNPVVFDWAVLVTAGASAVLVVLLGAAWPARRAARVEVLEALRYE